MSRRRLLAVAAALGAFPLLVGCVAAALPALAAGGLLRAKTERGAPEVSVGRPVAAEPTDQEATARSYTLDDGTRMEVLTGPLPPGDPVGAVTQPAPFAQAETLAAPGTSTGLAGLAAYDPFYAFAETQGTLPVIGNERRSAILADPGALAPTTRECSVHPAAVLIDLDPEGSVLDPAATLRADPMFARTLAALRAQGVAVAWVSGNTADRAGAIRRALTASGLDPAGRDELALLRYPEERKQTRRDDVSKQLCIVAIAGDERGDFDELFQYLKDPARAGALDALIGKGWFLIPQPLS